MCLNHMGGWFSKTQRDKKFDPGYWIKFLEPPCLLRQVTCGKLSAWIRVWFFEWKIPAGQIRINPQVNLWGALQQHKGMN